MDGARLTRDHEILRGKKIGARSNGSGEERDGEKRKFVKYRKAHSRDYAIEKLDSYAYVILRNESFARNNDFGDVMLLD